MELSHEKFKELLANELDEIFEMLVSKNKAYGNSALEPIRAHSKSDPIEQLNVRMDDKLSRLVRGEAAGEDASMDYVGYYFLKKVAEKVQKKEAIGVAQESCKKGGLVPILLNATTREEAFEAGRPKFQGKTTPPPIMDNLPCSRLCCDDGNPDFDAGK
jgi:hypothetical protein